MRWFRMYDEAIDDEKLRLLAFEDRWHFVAILCCKSKGMLDGNESRDLLYRKLGVKLGLHLKELENLQKRLEEVGLIGEDFQPTAWGKRQFVSDIDPTAAERKRRQREKNKFKNDVTDMSRVTVTECHGDVTRTEAETETDTDTEKTSICKPQDGLPACPAEKIVDLYHQTLPTSPRVAMLTKTRRGYLQQRWREFYEAGDFKTQEEGLEVFSGYFSFCSKSKFLTGKSKPTGDRPPFVADLEWLVKPANFAKVIEGKYA